METNYAQQNDLSLAKKPRPAYKDKSMIEVRKSTRIRRKK